jgi:hypothetical protein
VEDCSKIEHSLCRLFQAMSAVRHVCLLAEDDLSATGLEE